MKVTIVTPTYNEAENLEPLVGRILTAHPDFNIIVVDDNSPDGTGRIADRLAAADPRIQVIHRPQKAGLGRAYIAGFKRALEQEADLIFEMDADFSHDPKYLPRFMEAIQQTDVVIGSHYVNEMRVEGWRFRRLLLSKLANMHVRLLPDGQTGVGLHRRGYGILFDPAIRVRHRHRSTLSGFLLHQHRIGRATSTVLRCSPCSPAPSCRWSSSSGRRWCSSSSGGGRQRCRFSPGRYSPWALNGGRGVSCKAR